MSEATRQFNFAEVSKGSWLGEESILTETGRLTYTIRAKTKLRVLEIAAADLKRLLIPEVQKFLLKVSIDKHVMLLERMKQIIKASKHIHRVQDFKFFYDSALRTLIHLYPQANSSILK